MFSAKISTTMPWSTSKRIVQNAAQLFFSRPLGKGRKIVEKIEGLSLVDTSFAPINRDSSRPNKTISHILPSFTGRGGDYDTKYEVFTIRLNIASNRGGENLGGRGFT